MLKCTNMKMNETQRELLYNLAGCIICKILKKKKEKRKRKKRKKIVPYA